MSPQRTITRVGGAVAVAALLAAQVLTAPAALAVAPPVIDPAALPPDDTPGPTEEMRQNQGCAQPVVAGDPDVTQAPPGNTMLNLAKAWQYSTGAGVTVALIDTGVTPNPRFPALAGGGDYVQGLPNGGLTDCESHGTVVASIIAGAPSNPAVRPTARPANTTAPALPPPPPANPAPTSRTPTPPPPSTSTVTVTAPPPPPAPPPEDGPPAPDAPASGPADGKQPLVPGPPPGAPDGIVGVAPDATLISIRQSSVAFSPARPTPEEAQGHRKAGDILTLARAIRHAADLGAKVINVSLASCINAAAPVNQDPLGAAVRYAAIDKDAVIVAAAGNQGDPDQPDCGQNPAFNPLNPDDPRDWAGVRTIVTPAWFSDYVLSVAAVTPDGQPMPDSINGPWVSVAAPGFRILGLSSVNGAPVNALPDRDPGMGDGFWGTSFAAAYVSGEAALVRAKVPEFDRPPSDPANRRDRAQPGPRGGQPGRPRGGRPGGGADVRRSAGGPAPGRADHQQAACAAGPAAPGSAAAKHRADRRCGRAGAGRRDRRGGRAAPEDTVKAATVAVRPALPAVVAAEVVALAAFVALPPHRAGWWPATLISVLALLGLVITVHRRNAPGWVAAWARYRRRRRRPVAVAAAVDVPHGGIVCGVRVDAHEAISMVRVTGRAYAPTLLRGSTRSLTTNVLPLDVLAGLLDQPGGLRLAGIDVVNSGQRVRRAEGYPPLYSTLLADRPAAGRRDTNLIVRLDIARSVAGLSYRGSIGAAAAAATERIANALRQSGIRATALSADDLDAALADLSAALVAAPARPDTDSVGDSANEHALGVSAAPAHRSAAAPQTRWRSVHTTAGYLSNYYFSPEDITTAGLNQMWALRSDAIVQTTSLSKDRSVDRSRGASVLISAMVRTSDPQPPPQPPTLTLNPLPGEQYAAILRATPTARPRSTLPAGRLDDVEPPDIPIGATGILVGAALGDDPLASPPIQADDLVMLSLTDADRATRIAMDTSDFYVRQLLIRAAAVGECIAVYSHQPRRWESLTQPNIAVAERRRPPPFVPTITVNDRPTSLSAAGLSATVITLGPAPGVGSAPDLRFVQTSESTVQIHTPAQRLDVAIVAFRQEQAWMGLA